MPYPGLLQLPSQCLTRKQQNKDRKEY